MLEPLLLEGDAYEYLQTTDSEGKPDWDLASIASPAAVVFFANDLRYVADENENVFKFGPARDVEFSYRLPHWIRSPLQLKRLDADGLHDVKWSVRGEQVAVMDNRTLDAIYIAANDVAVFDSILQRRDQAIEHELNNSVTLEQIQQLSTDK